jgi:cytochrome b6-f complex iron-sulfur subunit
VDAGRRTILDWLLGISAAGALLAVVYPVIHFIFPPRRASGRSKGAVLAGRASELPPGSGLVFPLGARPAILVHTADGEWRAFSARCTHLSCTLRYREDLGLLFCPCHDGRFDRTGKNVGGPPPPGHSRSTRSCSRETKCT